MQMKDLCTMQELQHSAHGCPADLMYMSQIWFTLPDHCRLHPQV